jgi:hypothetical protein
MKGVPFSAGKGGLSVVKSTMGEASSGARFFGEKNAGISRRPSHVGKLVRAKGGQGGGLFAAVLEKTLKGLAAAAKTGRPKGVSRAAGPKNPESAGNGNFLLQQERRAGIAGKKKLPPREDSKKLSGDASPEKRAEYFAQAVATPVLPAAVKEERLPPAEGESPPRGVSPKSPAFSAFEGASGVKDAVRPGNGLYGENPAHEGARAVGEKTKSPAEKKRSLRQEEDGGRRGENREAAIKKPETPAAAIPVSEVKLSSAEESGQDSGRQEIEIRVVLRAVDERFEAVPRTAEERSVKESASGLARRLREEGNSGIVKSARFILRDRHEGEIRLLLKPESLGEVRIRLSLQDNLIGGRILVENENVRAVFVQNMPDLASAFRESGLELGSLAVSVGNGERRGGGEERSRNEARKAAPERETSLSSPGASAYYFVSHAVNVMA